MTPRAEIQHAMTGRVRVRIPEKRGDRSYFEWVAGALREMPEVETVETNPLTGSVLVFHRTDANSIVHRAEQAELFHVIAAAPREIPTIKAQHLLTAVDSRIASATSGGWDLNSLLMVVCAVAGGWQVARQNVWPAAASMFWYSLTLAASKNGVKQREP